MTSHQLPSKQGLYDPQFEHDACGVGFVVQMRGLASHDIVQQGLRILCNLEHRGACGSEVNTGDGAGMLVQVPHRFLQKVAAAEGFELPEPGQYGVGLVFTSPHADVRAESRRRFESVVAQMGQKVLGWRDVPTDNSTLGLTAQASEPFMQQVFIARAADLKDDLAFERKLYVIRKLAHVAIVKSGHDTYWYPTSLSCRTMVYKGMLTPPQVRDFFPDLSDPDFESALALVHSRFSTNTFPSWERSHPYRYIAHNGEINTLRGNTNWMVARQSMFESALFGEDMAKVKPVINVDGSDSTIFDNALELLVLAGRSLPHAVMMMIPEPWTGHESMDEATKAFYEYHACLMEPWDGPASVAFTDGTMIGAVLDRNGLRPSRYYVTKDDRVIMASEAGVLPVAPEQVLAKGRLQPGKMFLVDMAAGRIVGNEEVKSAIVNAQPNRQWLDQQQLSLESLSAKTPDPEVPGGSLRQRQMAFGYTFEELRMLLTPMAQNGVEAIGSMGTDTPLAVLSDKPKLLYDYIQQLFAQVTNPPIDSIREAIVTSAVTTLGSERNLLDPQPESCRLIQLQTPVLSNNDLAKLKHVDQPGFAALTLPILFDPKTGEQGLEATMAEIFERVDGEIATGTSLIILSDRGMDADHAPIPALLAVAGLHHHLIRMGTRTRASIILESGEPREVHHFAVLLGYGCSAINPYLAFETLDDMVSEGLLVDIAPDTAHKNYIKAVTKGTIKIASKIGISTLQSYRGAQIFEAIGLNQSVIDRYFTWTASRIEGIGIDVIAQEAIMRHGHGFAERGDAPVLDVGGNYQWRKDGEAHLFNPDTIHTLQQAVRAGDYDTYKRYAHLVNDQSKQHFTLRGLLDFKSRQPIPIEEVESVEAITRRFKTGAMSYGSISKEAHESLAIAMNRVGGKSNTGEGGEDPERFTWTNERGDSKNSAIKQVASGRFGVTPEYLMSAQQIEIKMAQGAKPGEGGQLPGRKVSDYIASLRRAKPGVTLISPPPHHDIYSIEDLAQLIFDLHQINPRAGVSVKLVSEIGIGTIAAGVAKANADVIQVSGHDGGTGASPLSSIKHAGVPWELGLTEVHRVLMKNQLRDRVLLRVDGGLKTGWDVIMGALMGAEEYGFGTIAMIAEGCIMARVCHTNSCPVGVTTQREELRKRFTGIPEHVVNFFHFVANEVRSLLAHLGYRSLSEVIGRADLLTERADVSLTKTEGLALDILTHLPDTRCDRSWLEHGDVNTNGAVLDDRLLADAEIQQAIANHGAVSKSWDVINTDRSVGARVSGSIAKQYGNTGFAGS